MKDLSQIDGITDVSKRAGSPFTRVIMEYEAKAAARIIVSYTEGDEDVLYLEKDANTFRWFVPGYVDGASRTGIEKIKYVTLEDKPAELKIVSLDFENVPAPSGDTSFIENDFLKVGVRLIWGGGVNYIEDKKCPVEGLKNLVNQYDTGRLIQQSYYGTGECAENPDFRFGEFMGHNWCYNPVQGGDRGNKRSRLIDFKKTADSIYIKAQPKDWGKVGWDTPSYMENTYILGGEMIRVDNRFVDFSCWTHGCNTQELPAFYTVSYLRRFTWYDGVESWQGKPLAVRDDLNFWGLPEYSESCTFRIRKSSTETWCAWVSPEDDYGIGLYVPNIDVLKAGKFSYDGSKRPEDSSTNYVAPLARVRIISMKPIEYSYLITTGSIGDIREKFTAHKDFAANARLSEDHVSARIEDDAPAY